MLLHTVKRPLNKCVTLDGKTYCVIEDLLYCSLGLTDMSGIFHQSPNMPRIICVCKGLLTLVKIVCVTAS